MNSGFWRGRRVLVTGHTGFKGSWMVAWLQRAGAATCGFALPPIDGSLFNTSSLADSMTSILADIRDAAAIAAAVQSFEPEVVIHMAAQALVRPSYEDPVGTYATNVMGTVHLLEALRSSASVRAVVVVTTDKCYENREWVWPYRESDRLGGDDPYASSKAAAELVTAAYRRSFLAARGVGVATARAGNVIGGGDWSQDRLLPDAVNALRSGITLRIRNPHAVRPWQHVLDAIHGYLLLAEKLHGDASAFEGAYNFGPFDHESATVAEVVERVIALWGSGSYAADAAPQPHESQLLRLDSSKARQTLGWKPLLNLDEALEWSVEWYQGASRGAGRELVGRHIDRYWEKLNAGVPLLQ